MLTGAGPSGAPLARSSASVLAKWSRPTRVAVSMDRLPSSHNTSFSKRPVSGQRVVSGAAQPPSSSSARKAVASAGCARRARREKRRRRHPSESGVLPERGGGGGARARTIWCTAPARDLCAPVCRPQPVTPSGDTQVRTPCQMAVPKVIGSEGRGVEGRRGHAGRGRVRRRPIVSHVTARGAEPREVARRGASRAVRGSEGREGQTP